MIELYLAVLQAGFYLMPINHHLVGPEIAYIVAGLRGEGVRRPRALRRRVRGRRRRSSTSLPTARFAIGAVPGFRPYEELKAGQPTTMPDDRRAGAVMNYTSGTTGKPKGVRRPLARHRPRGRRDRLLADASCDVRRAAGRRQRPHLRLAALPHRRAHVRGRRSLHLGHTVVLMDKWTPEDMLRLIEQHQVTNSHMVPTQFHRLLALPEEVRAEYDVLVAAPHGARRRAVPARGQAPDDRVVGRRDRRVLRRHRGRRHDRHAEEWLKKPGTVGKAVGRRPRSRSSTTRATSSPPGEIGTVYMALRPGRLRVLQGRGEDASKSRAAAFFTVGDIGYLDEDGYLFLLRPQDRHDHLRRRQHLPRRDRGACSSPTRRSATSPCSASRTTTGARR